MSDLLHLMCRFLWLLVAAIFYLIDSVLADLDSWERGFGSWIGFMALWILDSCVKWVKSFKNSSTRPTYFQQSCVDTIPSSPLSLPRFKALPLLQILITTWPYRIWKIQGIILNMLSPHYMKIDGPLNLFLTCNPPSMYSINIRRNGKVHIIPLASLYASLT